jgi:hypothetical protein
MRGISLNKKDEFIGRPFESRFGDNQRYLSTGDGEKGEDMPKQQRKL